MKNQFLSALILGITLLSSCEMSQNTDPQISTEPTVLFPSEKLNFSSFPQSTNSVKFLIFPKEDLKPFNRLILLNQDSDTLSISSLEPASFQRNQSIGEIEYGFEEGKSYQLLVEQVINADSVSIFQLPDYQHTFKADLNISSLATFERFGEFDLSPDRNYLFVKDFEGNTQSNHRIDINNGEILDLDNELGQKIRAIDKNNMLYVSPGTFESDIMLYNVEDKTSVPFGITRGNGGDVSRIADGHVVFSNPVEGENRTLTIVNLQSEERRVIPAFAFGNSLREYVIGQKIFGNSILDVESGTLGEELSPFQGTALLQYRPEEELVFYRQGLGPEAAEAGFSAKFVVAKKGGQVIFETEEKRHVTYTLPSEVKIVDNKFLVYVAYSAAQDEHRVSGFYQVDLSQGSMELVHAENRLNVQPNALVQLGDKRWLSIFSGEIQIYQLD
ncbi:MAG: hypothetical protein EA341_09140 [Mongoliibacter sp.]|uniref:hypothetical protein n=1 Tax=Mongoliibacter sp. TaxID=2022438 RepID=UPI0012F369FF|nr:hypothetical protein [Mongoliibacter sp.]TVP49598.1 MAG: hypothetical protein EA341_09140 [Mongoliibacter sp.]